MLDMIVMSVDKQSIGNISTWKGEYMNDATVVSLLIGLLILAIIMWLIYSWIADRYGELDNLREIMRVRYGRRR